MKNVLRLLLFSCGSVVAFALARPPQPTNHAPEISAGEAGLAVALVTAGLLTIRGRRKKR